jgi:hypothetical protein
LIYIKHSLIMVCNANVLTPDLHSTFANSLLSIAG